MAGRAEQAGRAGRREACEVFPSSLSCPPALPAPLPSPVGAAGPKGLPGNNCTILTADASRLAALLVGHMLPACSLLAPCDPGASTPRTVHLFPDRPLFYA